MLPLKNSAPQLGRPCLQCPAAPSRSISWLGMRQHVSHLLFSRACGPDRTGGRADRSPVSPCWRPKQTLIPPSGSCIGPTPNARPNRRTNAIHGVHKYPAKRLVRHELSQSTLVWAQGLLRAGNPASPPSLWSPGSRGHNAWPARPALLPEPLCGRDWHTEDVLKHNVPNPSPDRRPESSFAQKI